MFCKRNKEELLKLNDWKYNGGYYLSDWMLFENGMYQVSNDTVLKNNKAGALIGTIEYLMILTFYK